MVKFITLTYAWTHSHIRSQFFFNKVQHVHNKQQMGAIASIWTRLSKFDILLDEIKLSSALKA